MFYVEETRIAVNRDKQKIIKIENRYLCAPNTPTPLLRCSPPSTQRARSRSGNFALLKAQMAANQTLSKRSTFLVDEACGRVSFVRTGAVDRRNSIGHSTKRESIATPAPSARERDKKTKTTYLYTPQIIKQRGPNKTADECCRVFFVRVSHGYNRRQHRAPSFFVCVVPAHNTNHPGPVQTRVSTAVRFFTQQSTATPAAMHPAFALLFTSVATRPLACFSTSDDHQ